MYCDARLLNNKIYLSERINGVRKVSTHPAPYVYYLSDDMGTKKSLSGVRCKREHFIDKKTFFSSLNKDRSDGKQIFESEVDPVYRFLEEKYSSNDTPSMNISFIDIEADKDSERGWARPDNAFMPITAITIYNKWEDTYYTICTPPANMDYDTTKSLLISDIDEFGSLSEEKGYYVLYSEEELLEYFLEVIQDADIITHFNGRFYDIPYIINRIRHVLGKETLSKIEKENKEGQFNPTQISTKYLSKLCVFPTLPKMSKVEHYGSQESVYDFPGRPSIDYLELYKKFTLEPKHSYNLDAVLKDEIKQEKVKYNGTLDELHRNDFRRYIAYNRQDVAGLAALDSSKKMIELASMMAHMAGVTLEKVFGSVVIIEQAILKILHKMDIVSNDRKEVKDQGSVPGAYVYEPEGGKYKWICSFDINSLYPSIIRALNISPETLIGQFDLTLTNIKFLEYVKKYRKKNAKKDSKADNSESKAWSEFTGVLEYHHIINQDSINLTLHFEDGSEYSTSAKEWKEILKQNNWSLSANGTVFNLNKVGIIPYCLELWYNERTEFNQQKKKYTKLAKDNEGNFDHQKYKELADYYDMVQHSRKIFLNSVYGAYLNKFFRFYDARCGKSVTLSGRVVTRHMMHKVQELLEYRDYFEKD